MQNILDKALETLLRLGVNRSERGAILGCNDTEIKAEIVIELGSVLDEVTVREPSSQLLGRRPIELLKTGDVVLIADMFKTLKGE
ncbi:hypothetical protein [Vibrio parahaemolyticus]|uniref:hypothetical protein n=1 Tax=Vibrio parahaemolyticus TaxID=670 RepID=UPI00301CEFC6